MASIDSACDGVTARRNLLANALTLTMPGIPCLYYGTEAAIQDKEAAVHEDAETGRMTFLAARDAEPFQVLPQRDSFRDLSRLIELRKTLPALASPRTDILWLDSPEHNGDDGLFAFARGADTAEPIIVLVNASFKPATSRTPEALMELTDHSGAPLLRTGQKLEPIPWQSGYAGSVNSTIIAPIWRAGIPHAAITVPPESVRLRGFRVARVSPTQGEDRKAAEASCPRGPRKSKRFSASPDRSTKRLKPLLLPEGPTQE